MGVVVKGGKSKSTPSFLKKGAEAQAFLNSEEAKAEQRKEEAGKMFRFYIGKDHVGEDFRITFLDGDLTPDGSMIDCPMWSEHTVFHQGKWQNFIPPNPKDEPDPIQEQTGKDPALVFGLTIIDHSEYKSKDGKKSYKDERRLFVGKRGSYHQLLKYAQKRGGLAGCTFEVSRTTDEKPNVGDMFEFVEKRSLDELKKLYGDKVAPADWENELKYWSRDELIKLGFGNGAKVGGAGPSKDLSNEM